MNFFALPNFARFVFALPNSAQHTTMKVFSVSLTFYEDDYKHCGDDWSHSQVLGVFSSKKAAKIRLCSRFVQHIEQEADNVVKKLEKHGFSAERLKDIFVDREGVSHARLENHLNNPDNLWVKKEYCRDFDTLSEIIEIIAEGEFVCRTMSWKITETDVEDTDSESSEDEKYEESESESGSESKDEDEENASVSGGKSVQSPRKKQKILS